MGDRILEDQGRILLRMARESIGEKLGIVAPPEKKREEAFLDNKQGLFVTLHKQGVLRGCIGSIEAVSPLKTGVCNNARCAAFKDTRFSPLTAEEFHEIDIEVSLLSTPVPLEFKTPGELVAKLKPRIHGVIIKKGGAGATFLPQVWEQLPGCEEFLSQLCMKAGLSPTAWKEKGLGVQTYEVQCFAELP